MRVLMIGPFPPSPGRIDGGVAAAMTYLAEALIARRGVELAGVRVGASGARKAEDPAFDWPILDIPVGRLGLARRYHRERLLLDGFIEKFRPDIVHGQGLDFPGWLAVGCRVPSVVTVHGIIREEVRFLGSRTARARARLAEWMIGSRTLRRAGEVISISPYVTKYYGPEITGRVHNIPNAIAAGFFNVSRRPERGRLVFAGRLLERKGVLDLVRALALAPTAFTRLVVAGATSDPAFAGVVRKEVKRSGLGARVVFAGLLNEASLLEEFTRAEALVLPSHQETAPMVVQQAMAAGLAVVASAVGGVPAQIEHGVSGLLFECGRVEQLAAQLQRLHDDPSLSQRLGAAGRAKAVGAYGADRVASATRAAYDLILGRSRNGQAGES